MESTLIFKDALTFSEQFDNAVRIHMNSGLLTLVGTYKPLSRIKFRLYLLALSQIVFYGTWCSARWDRGSVRKDPWQQFLVITPLKYWNNIL
jgi:hypothetical protein